LFLDEPTTGLDPQARQQVWRIVRDYRNSGGTVLMTTHYMEEAAQLCDRLAIMDHGRVIALGTPDELIASLNAKQIVEFVPDAPPATEHCELLRSATQRGDWWVLHTDETSDTLHRLLDELKRQGRSLVKLRTHQPTLDDVFLHHTGKALRDA
jgi:ABC-2 type transport system ATP-binding protein